MLNKSYKKKITEDLILLDVYDVYWHRDTLYVINDYDMEAVESYLDVNGLLDVRAVLADQQVDLEQVWA